VWLKEDKGTVRESTFKKTEADLGVRISMNYWGIKLGGSKRILTNNCSYFRKFVKVLHLSIFDR
jgi:hypothetical protein